MCWRRQPKKLYILLGTNTLTTSGASPFSGLLRPDAGRAAPDAGRGLSLFCSGNCAAGTAWAAEKKPGLASDMLRGVNEQLAQLAAGEGYVYTGPVGGTG